MSRFWTTVIAGLACAVLWAPAAGWAGEEVLYGPVPAWVRPAPIPPPDPSRATGPIEILLVDSEGFMGAEGAELYSETAVRALNEQGLQFLGTVVQSWDPASETLTIHRLEIIRGTQRIDLLASGDPFLVLRQETDLTRALLNGRLTANRQIEGLEIGDIVHIAASVRRRHPAWGGHTEYVGGLTFPAVIGQVRLRAVWPASRPVRWRASEAAGTIRPVDTTHGRELVIDRRSLAVTNVPQDAPRRFADPAVIEVSDFGSWQDLSRLWAPLYAQATVLRTDSPVRAEAARIRAAYANPLQQAGEALRLVEQRVRYFAMAAGNGGYVPASADQTWSRRFGDCKGKTVLLLALLNELGIQAEPALVSTVAGDGLEARLPLVALFDHVILRVTVGGRTYWVDPTRTGDTSLEALPAPDYRWALPLRTEGADLTPIPISRPTRPMLETAIDLDASRGLEAQAIVITEIRMRGDAAEMFRQQVGGANHDEAERRLRESMARGGALTIDSVEISTDQPDGSVLIRAVSHGDQHWDELDETTRQVSLPGTSFVAAFADRTGPFADLPYALAFPAFTRSTLHVRLPRGGQGFEIVGADVNETTGGIAVRRTSRIADGVATIQLDVENVASETPAAEARAAERRLASLPTATQVVIRTHGYEMSVAEADALVRAMPTSASYLTRGDINMREERYAQAVADYGEAARLAPEDVTPLVRRSAARSKAGDHAGGLADAEAAVRMEPNDIGPLVLRAQRHDDLGQTTLAIADLDAALRLSPASATVFNARCWLRATRNIELSQAMEDCNEAIRLAPQAGGYLDSRGMVNLRLGRYADSIRDYDAALRLVPRLAMSLYGRGIARIRQGDRTAGEADLAAARAIGDDAQEDFERYGIRP